MLYDHDNWYGKRPSKDMQQMFTTDWRMNYKRSTKLQKQWGQNF
jgi:hypothetical protein